MDGNHVGDKMVLNNYPAHSDIVRFISTNRQSVKSLFNELRDLGILFWVYVLKIHESGLVRTPSSRVCGKDIRLDGGN